MINLLIDHFTPSVEFKFPVTRGRGVQISWMDFRPWIRYSVQNDSSFIGTVFVFAKKIATLHL